MNIHLKAIKTRVRKLRETSKEIKEKSREFNDSDLEDLHLEIECYCDNIETRIELLNKQEDKNGKTNKTKV